MRPYSTLEIGLSVTRGSAVLTLQSRSAIDSERVPSVGAARILIAEDNAINMQIAGFHVEDLGCSFAEATNGAIAVDLVRHQTFDYVLMDCQMPVMDGFQALREIRAYQKTIGGQQSIILAVTADDDAEHRMRCANAGFDGFLAKPFSAAELNAALLKCIRPGVEENSAVPILPDTSCSPDVTPVMDRETFGAFVADFGIDCAPSLLASFTKSLQEGAKKFAAAQQHCDTDALQALAHKFAGSAGTVGARRLAEMSREIQTVCKANKFKWSSDIERFSECISATLVVFAPLTDVSTLERAVQKM